MNNIKLSIIIPCYNVELYVADCLKSVIPQLNKYVELVVVNDGSTDKTRNIIDSFPEQDNIKIIDQDNGGLSVARNSGLKIVKGEYIAFLDGDDVVASNYIAIILNAINNYHPDIIEIDAYRFSDTIDNEAFSLCSFNGEKIISCLRELESVFYLGKWFVWGRIYNKRILLNELFEVGKRYEDIMFTPFIYLKAKKIYSTNEILLGYRHTPNSITKAIKDSDFYDIIYAMNKLNSIYINTKDSDEKYLIMISRVRTFNYLKFISNNIYGYFHIKNEIRDIARAILMDMSLLDRKFNLSKKDLYTIRFYRISNVISWLKLVLRNLFKRSIN